MGICDLEIGTRKINGTLVGPTNSASAPEVVDAMSSQKDNTRQYLAKDGFPVRCQYTLNERQASEFAAWLTASDRMIEGYEYMPLVEEMSSFEGYETVVTVPMLSRRFEHLNIPSFKASPCENRDACAPDQTTVYGATNHTLDGKCAHGFECADVREDAFPLTDNYGTFLHINGQCDARTCFFKSPHFEDADPDAMLRNAADERFASPTQPRSSLRHCCNDPTAEFCYHNLGWGNSCKVGYVVGADVPFERFGDPVYLPWTSWWGGKGYQDIDGCNKQIVQVDGNDKRYCGPQVLKRHTIVNNDDVPVFRVDEIKWEASPTKICKELYGRAAVDSAYVLGDREVAGSESEHPEIKRFDGNVICGPKVRSGVATPKVCGYGVTNSMPACPSGTRDCVTSDRLDTFSSPLIAAQPAQTYTKCFMPMDVHDKTLCRA